MLDKVLCVAGKADSIIPRGRVVMRIVVSSYLTWFDMCSESWRVPCVLNFSKVLAEVKALVSEQKNPQAHLISDRTQDSLNESLVSSPRPPSPRE
jgi:hypothetical protein